MTKDIVEALQDLPKELSSEIDLHDESEDFFALALTFETMRQAGKLLEAGGFPIAPVCVQVVTRFNSKRNSGGSDARHRPRRRRDHLRVLFSL